MIRRLSQKPLTVLLLALILIFFSNWLTFFLAKQLAIAETSLWFSVLVSLIAIFITLVIPLVVIKYVWNRNLADFGFRLPESTKVALQLGGAITVVSLFVMFLFSKLPDFQKYYSANHNVGISFVVIGLFLSLLYYVAEEFLFRGFLTFSLWDKWKFHSLWTVNLLFAFLHVGKPPLEIVFAFFVGVALSYLSLKTKSFIPAVIVHFILALTLNALVFVML